MNTSIKEIHDELNSAMNSLKALCQQTQAIIGCESATNATLSIARAQGLLQVLPHKLSFSHSQELMDSYLSKITELDTRIFALKSKVVHLEGRLADLPTLTKSAI